MVNLNLNRLENNCVRFHHLMRMQQFKEMTDKNLHKPVLTG